MYNIKFRKPKYRWSYFIFLQNANLDEIDYYPTDLRLINMAKYININTYFSHMKKSL